MLLPTPAAAPNDDDTYVNGKVSFASSNAYIYTRTHLSNFVIVPRHIEALGLPRLLINKARAIAETYEKITLSMLTPNMVRAMLLDLVDVVVAYPFAARYFVG